MYINLFTFYNFFFINNVNNRVNNSPNFTEIINNWKRMN